MNEPPRILFCHCAHARILPDAAKNAVLQQLRESGRRFEAVADLCALAAGRDPALQRWAAEDSLRIVACYPRAVKWLFAAAQAPLAPERVLLLNLRVQGAEEVGRALLDGAEGRVAPAGEDAALAPDPGKPAWFPVIDYDRCTQCMQCLGFCLFGVFGADEQRRISVQQPLNCKTNCPACSRVCPEAAIMFPQYHSAPINGEAVSETDLQREKIKIDLSALLGGDLYQVLRQRSERAKSRFSKERDPQQALEERQKCMARLAQAADIPPEVLRALPSAEELQRKAAEAMAKAQAARFVP